MSLRKVRAANKLYGDAKQVSRHIESEDCEIDFVWSIYIEDSEHDEPMSGVPQINVRVTASLREELFYIARAPTTVPNMKSFYSNPRSHWRCALTISLHDVSDPYIYTFQSGSAPEIFAPNTFQFVVADTTPQRLSEDPKAYREPALWKLYLHCDPETKRIARFQFQHNPLVHSSLTSLLHKDYEQNRLRFATSLLREVYLADARKRRRKNNSDDSDDHDDD
jgi:hypothetical protein